MNTKTHACNRKPPGNTAPVGRAPEADVLPRRIVLRGALAAGFGLLVPAALSGCDAQKQAGPAGSASPPPAADLASPETAPDRVSAAPAGAAKSSQASVQYQLQPKGEQKCANCMHFIAESNTCKRVEGKISPEGWCLIWANAA